ncbi:hypothetical protein P4C99_00480 [Pontiellaceae bacterium B1224]|nr:hypothetical protein [Pontiellaceae bacterium B1224]
MEESTLIKRRNSLTILLLILCFCAGWLSVYSVPQFTLVFFFAPAIVVTLLIITISQIKNRPIIQSYQWLILLCWPIAFPVYMIRFYKWKGLGIVLISFFAYLFCLNAGYYSALFLSR